MKIENVILKNIYTLLNNGYSVEETLRVCQIVFKESFVDELILMLKNGKSLEEGLMHVPISNEFKNYFQFYRNKNNIAQAIEKSLNISIKKQVYIKKIQSKISYPFALLIFLLLFSVFVITVLLPNVRTVFKSFELEQSLIISFMFLLFHLLPLMVILFLVVISVFFIRLLRALQKKKFMIIEQYLRIPIFKNYLKKYFSLKFAIYYNELLLEHYDSVAIIKILNEQMSHSDLKIILYEIGLLLEEGENLEKILSSFEYLDPLFIQFFEMYMKSSNQESSLGLYISMTSEYMQAKIEKIIKIVVPCIYMFVAFFIVTIYLSIILPMMNILGEI